MRTHWRVHVLQGAVRSGRATGTRPSPPDSDAPGAAADALTFLGTRQYNNTSIEIAVRWEDIALSRDPQDAQTLQRLALDQSLLGNLPAAGTALNRALAYGPDFEPVYADQISLALRGGRPGLARSGRPCLRPSGSAGTHVPDLSG